MCLIHFFSILYTENNERKVMANMLMFRTLKASEIEARIRSGKLRDIAKKYGYTSTENMTRNDFTLILRELEELLPCITDDYDPFGCEV